MHHINQAKCRVRDLWDQTRLRIVENALGGDDHDVRHCVVFKSPIPEYVHRYGHDNEISMVAL